MANKVFGKIAIFLVLAIFLLSTVSAVTVTDVTPVDTGTSTTQSFAQINARLTELTNAMNSARTQDSNFRETVMLKSDLPVMYNQVYSIIREGELSMLLNQVVLVTLCFCIFLILIGKNMIPQHRKEDKLSTTKENQRLNEENEKLLVELEKLKTPKEKKVWFKKSAPVPVPSAQNVLPVNSHLEALKKELVPTPKWQEEIIRAKARVELLEEMAKNNQVIK